MTKELDGEGKSGRAFKSLHDRQNVREVRPVVKGNPNPQRLSGAHGLDS